MANIPELQEAILKALDAVVTQRNNDLKLDKTITAIVKKNVGVRHGKPVYQVEYTGGILEAVCQSSEDIYIPQTSVYVLVPEGNFSKEKIIIGRASSIVTDRTASIVAAAVNQFSIIGTNLLLGKNDDIKNIQFGLRSFHPRSADEKRFHNKSHRYQVLYDASDSSNNSIVFDSERLNIYKEDSTALMIKADFLTNLDLAQRQKVGAKYGLIFNFVFENLNKGYGETNGEILENITKDIVLTEDEKTKSVFKLGEEFINNSESNLDLWKIENTGFIDQFLEKINTAYLNFQNKYPEKNTDLVTATLLAYQVAVSELKNCNSVEDIKTKYQEWKKTSVGDLEDKTISYAWTSDDMIGNPMSFNTWNTQYQVFNMDFKTLSHLESIVFFKEGFIEDEKFEQQWPISEISNGGGPDIFVRNLQIYAMNPLEIQSGDYTLKVESSTNSDMIFKGVDDEEITLKAFLTRKMYEDLSNNTNTSYIWFKEDSSVIGTQSDNYHALGGIGWRKISEGTSSSRYITLKSEDNQAYKNNYKCIAIYEPSSDDKAILSYPFIVYNTAAQIDIILESDLGTHFSYDAGTPTIRVLIKDPTTEENFYELGYSPQEQNPKYKYKWAIADSANNYTLFLDEVFNDEGISESGMINSIKQSQLNKIEKIIQYEGSSLKTEIPWRATRIKYPVSISSSGFTVTCYVQKIKDEFASEIEYVDVGSASLEFLNQEDSITSDYRIQIVNGDQVFQYDEYGDSPCSTKKKNPLEILPLQVKLYTPSGIEVSGSNYQVKWIFPIENTLISLKENEDGDNPQFIINPATNLLQLIKGHEVNFDIAKIYDPNAFANQITCHVSFGGKDYYKDTNFYFGKQGSNGTNGTDFVAKIGYIGNSVNDDLSLLIREPLTLYLQKTENDSNNKMFNVDKKWWEGNISSDKFGITSEDNESRGLSLSLYQKDTEIKPTIYQWSLAGNPLQDEETLNTFGKYFQTETNNDTVLTKIVFNDELKNNQLLIQNIRAEAKVITKDENNNKITQSYYAFYSLPIIWYEKIDEEKNISDVTKLLSINKIAIDKHFYLNEIVYNADGRNPIYNHNQGLKLINIPDSIKKIIFTAKGGSSDTENTTCIKLLNRKDDQNNNSLLKIILKRNEEDSTLWDIYNIIKNKEEFISTINEPMVYVLPDDIYDGNATNNRIEAELYNYINEKENLVATVYAPINMTLNTFGLTSLNAWDGNTVTIDREGGYVMAPQIGAGEKDDNNRFTGILMGKTKTYTGRADNEEETGLFGYSHGLQSIFLDAKTGNATFGLPDGNTLVEEENKEGKKVLVPSNTGDNYKEGRIELRPGDISKIGGWRLGRTSLYYVTKFNYGHEKKPGEEGYTEEEEHYYTDGLGEVEGPYRGDYVPKPKTGEIGWDGENNSGYYNQYHVKDIPHKSSGILLQAGENPYISIKGKPLNKDEVKEMNKINNSLNDSPQDDSEKLYEESDSYLKEGDSLEIQLDPSAPSLFSIFRHNGSDRFEQKIQESENNLPIKYHKDTRTFLAGINGKGEFVANSISNVTTTLPAFVTNANDNTNYPETSYTTNFAVNTIPAFNDRKANPTHIGFKMDVGNNTLGQLFISALGITPNPIEDQSWKINDYNSEKNRHSIDTDIRKDSDGNLFLIKDPTLRISGGRVNLDKNDINPYGEYIRPIALHGKSISLFSYPTDYDTEELRSKVLFSNNHLILETDNNTSKFQLSLGDNIGSSNTLIHLKGYDDTNINNEEIKGSQINIATDLYTNIGIFNPSNKMIEYIKNDEGNFLRPIWQYGSDRYIKINDRFVNTSWIYQGFYIQSTTDNSYQFIEELIPYFKITGKDNYVKDKEEIKNSYYKITYTYKIEDDNKYITFYILCSEFKMNLYNKNNNNYSIIGENDSITKNYYLSIPQDDETSGNEYYFIQKSQINSNNIYYKGRKYNNNFYYYYKINLSDAYYHFSDDNVEDKWISQRKYDKDNQYSYVKLKKINDNNDEDSFYNENDIQLFGYKIDKNNSYIKKIIVDSAILFEKDKNNDESDGDNKESYQKIIESEKINQIWTSWFNGTFNGELKWNYIYIQNWEDNSYIRLKDIKSNKVCYILNNNLNEQYEKVDDEYYQKINEKYYNKNIKKDDYLYYKNGTENYYIFDVDQSTYYYKWKSDSDVYLSFKEIIFSNEYTNENDASIISQQSSINNNKRYYKTTRIKNSFKQLNDNNLTWDQKKYYLTKNATNNDEYINETSLSFENNKKYYYINNDGWTEEEQLNKYIKIQNETGRNEYLEVSKTDDLNIEYIKNIDYIKDIDSEKEEYIPLDAEHIGKQISLKTIPTKAEYYASGKIEANIGTSVDTYTTLKISDEEISLDNQKPKPILLNTPKSGFVLRTNVGELNFNESTTKYNSFFPKNTLHDIKAKFVIFKQVDNANYLEYGLSLTNNGFVLKSSNYGEISTDDKIRIVANAVGKDEMHTVFNPQILLRAGGSDTDVYTGGSDSKAELILNSSTTSWNGLRNLPQAEYDARVFNYPVFAVRSRGGNIGIYPEYFSNRRFYRENFVVNMNQSIAGGLSVQDAYKGAIWIGPNITGNRTWSDLEQHRQHHLISIKSTYSIETQNYVKAGRFFGDGTWINNTTDLEENKFYGSCSINGRLDNQWLYLQISVPNIGISNGRLNDVGNCSSNANYAIDLRAFTTVDEVNSLIDAKIATLGIDTITSDIAAIKTKLDKFIDAYNIHIHPFTGVKEGSKSTTEQITSKVNK